ncbi:MAG: hypothetical protein HG459_006425 [Bacteroidia bacterium]|nr:hypothetical protein [Bacteroidia bacterium]MBB1540951.1 hypothetical protein [Bacteroidia bacterium]
MKEKYILRKVYLSAVAVLLSIGWAAGQPRAVSVRLGWISELSYQHTLGPGFLEVGAGIPWLAACPTVTATYNYIPWTFRNDVGGVFDIYFGGGLGVGTFIFPCGRGIEVYPVGGGIEVYPVGGVVVPVGFQFRTASHFLLSISWRPMFGAFFSDVRPVWYKQGLYDGGLTLGYAF